MDMSKNFAKTLPICEYCSQRGHDFEHCTVKSDINKKNGVQTVTKRIWLHPKTDKYQTNSQILKIAHSSDPPLSFKEAQQI